MNNIGFSTDDLTRVCNITWLYNNFYSNRISALSWRPIHLELTFTNRSYFLRKIFESKTWNFLYKDSTLPLDFRQNIRVTAWEWGIQQLISLLLPFRHIFLRYTIRVNGQFSFWFFGSNFLLFWWNYDLCKEKLFIHFFQLCK